MSVNIHVLLQSLLALAELSNDIAQMIKRINEGGEVTDDEWENLRVRLVDANDAWERAG